MQVTQLTEMVARLTQLRLDHTEYTCLKALVLFKPEVVGLKQGLQVEVLQDQTHLMLQVPSPKKYLATDSLFKVVQLRKLSVLHIQQKDFCLCQVVCNL